MRNIGCLLREQPRGRHATPLCRVGDRGTARDMRAVGRETPPQGAGSNRCDGRGVRIATRGALPINLPLNFRTLRKFAYF